MELRQFEHFVAVVEEGHFNRAASRCHIVRSGLSASIRSLERELGALLLVRTTRELRLTAAGQAFLVEARRTLAAATAAREAVREVGDLLRGTLSLGITQGNRSVDLPAALARFHDAHPAVTVSITRGASTVILDHIVAGDVDLALTYLPAHLPSTFHVEVLDSGPMVLVCGADHPLAGRATVSLDELGGDNFIKVPFKWAARTVVDEACEKAGLGRTSWLEANDLATLLDLVRFGLGVAIVPGPDAGGAGSIMVRKADVDARGHDDAAPPVCYVPLEPGGPQWAFGIVVVSPGASNAAARAFTEALFVRERRPAEHEGAARPSSVDERGGLVGATHESDELVDVRGAG